MAVHPSEEIYQKLVEEFEAGNFNAFILAFAKSYEELRPVRHYLLEKVALCVSQYPGLLSPESIKALRRIPLSHLQAFMNPEGLELLSKKGRRKKYSEKGKPS